jgi:hypothetical protein
MDAAPKTFLWISLAAHVAVGAVVYARASRAPDPVATPSRGPEALLSGDTFEVPEELPALDPEPSPASAPEPTPAAEPPRPHSVRSIGAHTDPGESRTGGGESNAGTVFGASGERASADLATAFTRGFPQAASADPAWISVPFGSAGEATVVLQIDEDGALVAARVEGNPSPALRAGITRTIALIRARAFTAARPVTKLHLKARVSSDEVHDGLHGEVFAVGGSFDKLQGSAFFALSIGRRVDLEVTE